jgi:hypothetical protein
MRQFHSVHHGWIRKALADGHSREAIAEDVKELEATM